MNRETNSETAYEEPQLSRACLLCTNTEDNFRKSLMLIAVPGLHIAHIIRGIPKSDIPQRAGHDEDEDSEALIVNIEEAEFLIERFQEWIAAHKAYNAAHPGMMGVKRYTAEVKNG